MRYDTPIYFQNVTQGVYNANTGDYSDESIIETKCFAAVSSCSVETLKLVYGDLKQGALKLQLQNHYPNSFNRIRIKDKLYSVDYGKKLRTKHVLVVSEIQ